jgi:hypothetical protein
MWITGKWIQTLYYYHLCYSTTLLLAWCYEHFGNIYCLHLHGRSHLNPEDGVSLLHRNGDTDLQDHKVVSYPRSLNYVHLYLLPTNITRRSNHNFLLLTSTLSYMLRLSSVIFREISFNTKEFLFCRNSVALTNCPWRLLRAAKTCRGVCYVII